MLLATQSRDDAEKQQRDANFFRTALGDDYEQVVSLHRSGRDTEICGKLRVLQILLKKWKEEQNKISLFSHTTIYKDKFF